MHVIQEQLRERLLERIRHGAVPNSLYARPEMNPYFDKLAPVVAEIRDAAADGKLSWSEAWEVLAACVAYVRELLPTLAVFNAEDEAQIVAAVEQVYDTYIEPLDMPGPDAIVDPITKSIIVNATKGALRRFRHTVGTQAAA